MNMVYMISVMKTHGVHGFSMICYLWSFVKIWPSRTNNEDIIAVKGTHESIAILPIRADEISVTTWFKLKNFCKSIPFESKTNGKDAPKYTKINVFDMVPMISFPTFMPELNNFFHDKVLSVR